VETVAPNRGITRKAVTMAKQLKRWGNGGEYPEVFDYLHSNLLNHFRTGNAEAVRAFLSQEPQWLGYWYFGKTLLHKAAGRDYPNVLSVLVELGLDVNSPQEQYPWGAIETAVISGFLASAQCLLEHGAVTTFHHRGLTFGCGTLWSVVSGNLEMVKLLVEHGAPVDILTDDPPRGLLTAAIGTENAEMIDYLRSKGALTDEEIIARDKKTKTKRKKK
jgi:hypothetical protein